MNTRFRRYAPVVLLFALASAVACDRTADSPTSPELVRQVQTSITAEPRSVQPEFLTSPACVGRRPFGARVTVIVEGRDGLILRDLRFAFVDRFGTRTLPEVIPIPTASSSIPSSSPISIPGVAALPSASPVLGPLPFFVRFGCDVIPEGTLIITAEAVGRAMEATEMRVQIGG
jgi:hypothetical protein